MRNITHKTDNGLRQAENKRPGSTRVLQDSREATHQKHSTVQRNNTGLPDNLKSGLERLSGYSMDDVRVHYNSARPAQLNAHAYAQGTDIHLASGQEEHLPHEAWHAVQQKQGRVKPTLTTDTGVNINDNQGLEQEADEMGDKALQFKFDSAFARSKTNRVTTPFHLSDNRRGTHTAIPIQRRPFVYNGEQRDTDEFTSEELAQMLPPDQHEQKEMDKEKSRRQRAIKKDGFDLEGTLSPKHKVRRVADLGQQSEIRLAVGARTNATMDEHHRPSVPIGALKKILNKYDISPVEFARLAGKDNSSIATLALKEYENIHGGGARGEAHGQMVRSLIAHSEIRSLGVDRQIDVNTFGSADNVVPEGLREASTLADKNKDSIMKAYEISEDEHAAIMHYTNADTNIRMKEQFGDPAIGWRHLSSAMKKLPSTGDLGLLHSSFRAGRENEGKKIMKLGAGTAVFHGYMPMSHGQYHYMSTATTYSQFASAKRVGKAGGIVGMQGTSGRYINPFGVQGSATDGAEVLYPPSTFSQYKGSVNTGAKDVAYHQFMEIPPKGENINAILGTHGFVEDQHYGYIRWGESSR